MKFYKIQNWDYMDEFPTTSVMVFESAEKAQEYVMHMQKNYSGGSTQLMCEMDLNEALEYVHECFKREMEHPQEDSSEFLERVTKAFKDCYGAEADVIAYLKR